jgi:hypothetical protein
VIGVRITLTISQQLRCGGLYVGQLIATKLELRYVDREVLHIAAQEFGCDEEMVAARCEKLSPFWERMFGGFSLGSPEAPYTPPRFEVLRTKSYSRSRPRY